LKRNLKEHLEDLEQWRDLYNVDLDPSKLTVYDENKVQADLEGKKFEDQVSYLSDKLQEENRTLTRILRVKDSKHDLENTVSMQATLYMKTEKKGPWTPHYFKLFSEDLVYYTDAASEDRMGAVSLREPDTTVTLLKPENADGGDKLYPIKLKLTSGQQFYVATLTKKDRKVTRCFLVAFFFSRSKRTGRRFSTGALCTLRTWRPPRRSRCGPTRAC
jgi:hypothetical protein